MRAALTRVGRRRYDSAPGLRPTRFIPVLATVVLVVVAVAMAPVANSVTVEGEPRLTVSMFVDKMVAKPGDMVRYEVRVENLGDGDALEVVVTSHIPGHTTAASQNCPDGVIEPDGDICLQPDAPTPGLGQASHQIVHGFSPMRAGEGVTLRFAVRVDDDAPVGLHLPNHAHADAGTARADSAPVDTLVVDLLPLGFFGGSGFDASGQLVTASFDSGDSGNGSSLTDSGGGGHISSNGDISVAGGSFVDGDARPGPDATVTVTGGAVVTGSTSSAPAPVALTMVDALAYETNNDNERICRDETACDGVVFDAEARTLVVEGEAILEPGAYYLCSLEVRGTLRVERAVTLWIGPPEACDGAGSVRFASHATVTSDSALPRDLQLRLEGSDSIATTAHVTSHSHFEGMLYAPRSRLVVDAGAVISGGAVTGEVTAGSGGALLRVDRSLC